MSKVGYISIITGILALISYSLYILLVDLEVPLIIKIGILLVVFGSMFILIKQIASRKKEKIEEEKYKDY